ncbi:SRPBCC family protein [Fodinicola feengrottensis]|uniref:SRPBCC family protein n=1 Tax=Fodinicola feengrottensis TaxID=435914 RepID=A0ABP4S3Q7_9ACTN|nr:SRPBCC family protein [Fodinicola feengrottensis]
MASQHVRVESTTTADPATVYALLRDGSGWPEFTPLGSYELVSAGTGEPTELGEIRIFHTGRFHAREQIVEMIENRRLSYVLLAGMPLRGYRADVDLEPTDSGTLIRWHSTFDPKTFGTGWLYRTQLQGFIQKTADGLAARATEVARDR